MGGRRRYGGGRGRGVVYDDHFAEFSVVVDLLDFAVADDALLWSASLAGDDGWGGHDSGGMGASEIERRGMELVEVWGGHVGANDSLHGREEMVVVEDEERERESEGD